MDNSMGFASERSLNFKKLLEEKCSLPVNLVDERLSTVEAESILIENNYSRKKKNNIDELSACIILDTYLRKVG
ncbi:MAG: Holliday junction resolvase RuvX [Clostridium sp.]|nr:MAG: Holliday junction resolvase RuvX [Clostridium sp.]